MKRILLAIWFLILLFSSFTLSQDEEKKEYVTVIPNESYKKGGLYNFFFGEHWRREWATPIKVEVLDISTFAGGLTPFEKGGGLQTKSIKFKDAQGKVWKFRSVDKDPTAILPVDLQETVVEKVIQDQVSTAYPVGPLVVVPILKAVDILQVEPKLFYLKDDEKLGEYQLEFGGMLGMIELHPDETEIYEGEDKPGFAGSEKIMGTYKLLNRLEEETDEFIHATDFLKVRLVDVLLNDWDRHTDQWRWAKYDYDAEREVWLPIPRDRDQVFSKFDGIFPWLSSYLVPQLNSFNYDYPQAEDIVWSGRVLDRRVLVQLNKEEWDSVTSFVQNRITDEVIEEAVKSQPTELIPISYDEITSKLKARRDKLHEISFEIFKYLNETADVYASGEDDLVTVKRINDRETEVTVYPIDKDTDEKEYYTLFHKVFNYEYTDEIRIYLLDGDDKVKLTGEVERGPLVRIIGGDGADEIIDSSVVNGYFLYVTPFPDMENKTRIYDSGDKTDIIYSESTTYNDEKIPEPKNDEEKFELKHRNRGHDILIVPTFGLDSENGLMFGGGPWITKYNFRAIPYQWRMKFTAGYYTGPGSYFLDYDADFYRLIEGSWINLHLNKSELFLTRYFGFGNETNYDQDLEDNDFYKLDQEYILIQPTLMHRFGPGVVAGTGIQYRYFDTHLDNESLLTGFNNGTNGLRQTRMLGFHAMVEVDHRDVDGYPMAGYFISASGASYPRIFYKHREYSKAGFDARKYFTLESITNFTLALRVGGEKVWGNYPFYDAAILGGSENLRGYSAGRFSGDASVYSQAELRIQLFERKLLLKGKVGVFFFAETGRVFIEGEDSDKWHPSYGGGFFTSYIHRRVSIVGTIANSPDKLSVSLRINMAF